MNLRHAAALALVFWYFVAPPLYRLGPANDPKAEIVTGIKAPLSEWTILARFDTATECYGYPARFQTPQTNPKAASAARYWFAKAICIAADDPRMSHVKIPPAKDITVPSHKGKGN
ncbi:hypothetical protein [Candidatus Binatus sp.]|uniref:hypothetical protein n=1 Tax=Candidatus Binatus sp. TaxID=2811406 RepID=UPI003BB12BDD